MALYGSGAVRQAWLLPLVANGPMPSIQMISQILVVSSMVLFTVRCLAVAGVTVRGAAPVPRAGFTVPWYCGATAVGAPRASHFDAA